MKKSVVIAILAGGIALATAGGASAHGTHTTVYVGVNPYGWLGYAPRGYYAPPYGHRHYYRKHYRQHRSYWRGHAEGRRDAHHFHHRDRDRRHDRDRDHDRYRDRDHDRYRDHDRDRRH